MFQKKEITLIGEILILVFLSSLVSSQHYILGYVNDAHSGVLANGKTAILWNQNNPLDNLTNTISVNSFSFDCEQFSTPCSSGDNISVQVFSSTNESLSKAYNLTVSSNNEDYFETFRLNSKPTISLNLPQNNSFVKNPQVINCSFLDLDSETISINIFANFSGVMDSVNSTTGVSGNLIYSNNHSDGHYSSYCCASDEISIQCTENIFFTSDSTKPHLDYFTLNETTFCGNGTLNLKCSFSDVNFRNISLSINTPSKNYFFSSESSSMEINFSVNETGDYSASCIGLDKSGNQETSDTEFFSKLDLLPDLSPKQINYSNPSPIEGEVCFVSVLIENKGCTASGNFDTGFYEGSVSPENLLQIKTTSLSPLEEVYLTYNFTAAIGQTEHIFVVDYDSSVVELNESNNEEISTISISLWQEFFGTIQAFRVLANTDLKFLTNWGNDSEYQGNIFVTDRESEIDWFNLVSIGKNIQGEDTPENFGVIDSILGTSSFPDSISNTFSESFLKNYSFNGQTIDAVPSILSSSADPFFTGILWDSTKDTNGYFDENDREEIVFISEIKRDNICQTDKNCDFEIKIPAKLREYSSAIDTENIYLYYNLI